MLSLKVLIVEDIVLTALDLRNSLERSGHFVTGIARNLAEAQRSVHQSPPDVALVDIILEGSELSGIEVAQHLNNLHPMPIIYLTANSENEQFTRAQATHPAAYLLKPFKIGDVLFNIELAYHNFSQKEDNSDHARSLMLPTNGGHERIDLDRVTFLKGNDGYTDVFLTDGTNLLVSSGLGQVAHYFRHPNFFRLSRSYVVNIQYIKRIKEGELIMLDGTTRISLPGGIKKELLNRFTVVKTKQPK